MRKRTVIVLSALSIFASGPSTQAKEACRLIDAKLYVAEDPGHGGAYTTDAIHRCGQDGNFHIEKKVDSGFPSPGYEDNFKPSRKTSSIQRSDEKAQDFFSTLERLKVLSWKDRKTKRALLHPISYRFEFRDSCGNEGKFEYEIEGAESVDKKYDALVKTFEDFFGPAGQ